MQINNIQWVTPNSSQSLGNGARDGVTWPCFIWSILLDFYLYIYFFPSFSPTMIFHFILCTVTSDSLHEYLDGFRPSLSVLQNRKRNKLGKRCSQELCMTVVSNEDLCVITCWQYRNILIHVQFVYIEVCYDWWLYWREKVKRCYLVGFLGSTRTDEVFSFCMQGSQYTNYVCGKVPKPFSCGGATFTSIIRCLFASRGKISK